MTFDPRTNTPPSASPTLALPVRQRWALAVAAGVAVGLGAMLGHGLGQSLAAVLPAAWHGFSPALIGAMVAMLGAPLGAWLALRIVAPARPAGSTPAAAPAPRSARSMLSAWRPAGKAAKTGSAQETMVSASADPQAPARDALTGAYTQLHFVAAADREWSRIRRHGEDAALLMIDVDHFRRLNDDHGMPCGDAMLVEITRQAASTLRPYDLLARFGGGVLVVYLPHTDPLGALDVAERIRDRVAGLHLNWQGKKVKATVSVGAAGIGVAHAALDAVIADAGAALREAKAAGRNCVRAAPIPPRRNPTTARSAG